MQWIKFQIVTLHLSMSCPFEIAHILWRMLFGRSQSGSKLCKMIHRACFMFHWYFWKFGKRLIKKALSIAHFCLRKTRNLIAKSSGYDAISFWGSQMSTLLLMFWIHIAGAATWLPSRCYRRCRRREVTRTFCSEDSTTTCSARSSRPATSGVDIADSGHRCKCAWRSTRSSIPWPGGLPSSRRHHSSKRYKVLQAASCERKRQSTFFAL